MQVNRVSGLDPSPTLPLQSSARKHVHIVHRYEGEGEDLLHARAASTGGHIRLDSSGEWISR